MLDGRRLSSSAAKPNRILSVFSVYSVYIEYIEREGIDMTSKLTLDDARRPGRIPAAFLALVLLFVSGTFLWGGQVKVKPKDLAIQYQDWLKSVDYIIKDKERDVFLHLTMDRERDLFIEAFWRLRDPRKSVV